MRSALSAGSLAQALLYRPKGQRLLAALQWPAIVGGFHRDLVPAGALIITERDLVFISEEKQSPRQLAGDTHEFGGIITYFPRVRVAESHVSVHERFGVLDLPVHAASGGEKLEIVFPADYEDRVAKATEALLLPVGHST